MARQFHLSLSTVQYLSARHPGELSIHALDLKDRRRGPKKCPNRSSVSVEKAVIEARHRLASGPLGESGAAVIHHDLSKTLAEQDLPSVRTIGRILQRQGLLDQKLRVRRPPPPPGWYLPAVASRTCELDSFDGVEGLVIAGGQEVEVFNAVSLHGGLPGSWAHERLLTDHVLANLITHWKAHGLPGYAQFDNDTLFQGPHHLTDVLGRVTRLCLQLGVIPVFVPPQEPGFQAAIENYNGRWQTKVWNRFVHRDLDGLNVRSNAYVSALRARLAQRIDAAPARRSWPKSFRFKATLPPSGTLIYLRRTDEHWQAIVLGRPYLVDPTWQHRLVRAEVSFENDSMNFHSLRRKDPSSQPLLRSITYHFPPASEKRGKAVADNAHKALSR